MVELVDRVLEWCGQPAFSTWWEVPLYAAVAGGVWWLMMLAG